MSEFVSPADAEDSLQATDVVRFQLSQLVTVESPCFCAVQQGGETNSAVYIDSRG